MELRLIEQACGCSTVCACKMEADSRCVLVFCRWHSGGGECLLPPMPATCRCLLLLQTRPPGIAVGRGSVFE